MKFIGYYGCSNESNIIALEASSKEKANNYVYECACECYGRYYHYHCYYENENGGDEEYIDEERENDINYCVEPFDYNNEEHMNILREQENEFWEV